MVLVDIGSSFLSGKQCFEKTIRSITICNEGTIVDAQDMKGRDVKKLELEVLLPDGSKVRWCPNQTSKKSLVKLYGTESSAWNGKKVKLALTPFQDTYAINVDELETAELNKKGAGRNASL